MLIDVHCHLDLFSEKEIAEIVERAENSEVKAIITNGLDKSTNRKSLELAEKYEIVKPALGIYPADALKREKGQMKIGEEDEFGIKEELKFIEEQKDKIIAIGEVGLDFVHGQSKQQEEIFIKLIELSKKINKPLIVHSRKAEEEAIKLLEEYKAKKVILHCFNGSMGLVDKAIKLGFFFSIPCIITRSKHFQNLTKKIPLSRIFTETDAPFLSPYPGKKNEPSFVSITIKKIAELKGLNEKEAENNIFMNWQKMFL